MRAPVNTTTCGAPRAEIAMATLSLSGPEGAGERLYDVRRDVRGTCHIREQQDPEVGDVRRHIQTANREQTHNDG
jgi:hypothetical protein